LQGDLNNAGLIFGFGRRSGTKTDGTQEEAEPDGFHFHIGCIRNEMLEKSKSSSRKAQKP
jgi:hypothetical protein